VETAETCMALPLPPLQAWEEATTDHDHVTTSKLEILGVSTLVIEF